jgi:uncharacterized iron-regulated protein
MALLGACAHSPTTHPWPAHLWSLGALDVLLLGEQHDAPDHQHLHTTAITTLGPGRLAAVVLEMADAGRNTRALPVHAQAAQVQAALAWVDAAWPWANYGPAVMAAVAQGIPVLGGNLPRSRHSDVMRDATWDRRVPPAVAHALQSAVREGHCQLLPEPHIQPMTRIQIARDATLADTVMSSLEHTRTVLVLCGSQHAHRQQGIPAHLPPHLRVYSVHLQATAAASTTPLQTPATHQDRPFDLTWPTPAVPVQDHCARLRSPGGVQDKKPNV